MFEDGRIKDKFKFDIANWFWEFFAMIDDDKYSISHPSYKNLKADAELKAIDKQSIVNNHINDMKIISNQQNNKKRNLINENDNIE